MRFTLNRFTRSTSLVLATILTAALLPGTALAAKVLRYSDHEPLGGMRTRFKAPGPSWKSRSGCLSFKRPRRPELLSACSASGPNPSP